MTKDSAEEAKEDAAAIRKAKKADDEGLTLQQVQIRAVRRIQAQFLGHVLRRTIDSQNWSGERLLALPPFKTIVGVLTLSDREMEILVQRQQDAQAKWLISSMYKKIANDSNQVHPQETKPENSRHAYVHQEFWSIIYSLILE